MIYIVSGIHRSGTSMMMDLLVQSGIRPYYSKIREKQMQHGKDDYKLNKNFWETGVNDYMQLGFTSELPDNCCVKIPAIGLPILSPAVGYKIIYMRRDPDSIRNSYIRAMPDDDFDNKYPSWPSHYWRLLDGVKGIMQTRRDVDLIELWYDDILKDPLNTIKKLIAHDIPILESVVDLIDPQQRRF